MARKTQVLLVDDIDGSDATSTVTFGLDGVSYEIDLNDDNTRQLRSELETWTVLARRTGGRARRGTGASTGDAAKIRQWAVENGYEVSERGRIRADIREAYAKAN
ncbi:histone-like nucleoid-structuring protein Lsr2 [Brachybacterium alimentarium]|uniref:histone-like nucleoid-structuring protein Lsr2 n=1 Tax=Brachybacterium alimentarium TaxID=47845 RepID=UPI003FD2250B